MSIAYTHSDFFLLRTPLLPVDTLIAQDNFGARHSAPLSRTHGSRTCSDKHLIELIERPEIRKALYISSAEGFKRLLSEQNSDSTLNTLYRYLSRMSLRSTPFGINAGITYGAIDSTTSLIVAPCSQYKIKLRVSYDIVSAIVTYLEKDNAVRKALLWRTNETLYEMGDNVRYIYVNREDSQSKYSLVQSDKSTALSLILAVAKAGTTFEQMAASLEKVSSSKERISKYINELIDRQILISSLQVPVTGIEDAYKWLYETVETLSPKQTAVLELLRDIKNMVHYLNNTSIFGNVDSLQKVIDKINHLGIDLPGTSVLHAELEKPAVRVSLGNEEIKKILKGVELLRLIPPPAFADDLKEFKEKFAIRYGDSRVPLCEALDAISGIGFGNNNDDEGISSMISLPEVEPDVNTYVPPMMLVNKLGETLQNGELEMQIATSELAAMFPAPQTPLPDAFMASLCLLRSDAVESESPARYQIFLRGTTGPSGIRQIARFGLDNSAILEGLSRHISQEEALHPDKIFAEIIHLPQERFGNILSRPILRAKDICIAACGKDASRNLELADLEVWIQDNTVKLFSSKLGKEICPRTSTAHNTISPNSLTVYRFLSALQYQGVAAWMGWDWSRLKRFPFLPRVTVDGIILCRARWSINQREIVQLGANRPIDITKFDEFRKQRRLPRYVTLAEGDRELTFDLNDTRGVECLLSYIKNRPACSLLETFFDKSDLVESEDGRFTHEIMLPFVRKSEGAVSAEEPLPPQEDEKFYPGSEWLSYKIFGGPRDIDEFLKRALSRIISRHVGRNQWFFVRFGQKEWHLRLRFRAKEDCQAIIRSEVSAAVQNTKEIYRLEIDTYRPERKRYGGFSGVRLAEEYFSYDSECALEVIKSIKSSERWLAALTNASSLLSQFFSPKLSLRALTSANISYAKEFRLDSASKAAISKVIREHKPVFDIWLGDSSPVHEVYNRRTLASGRVVGQMKRLVDSGEICGGVERYVTSLLHMSLNRILVSNPRKTEMLVYQILSRHYRGVIARSCD